MQDLQKMWLQGLSLTGESIGSVMQIGHASGVLGTGTRPVARNSVRVGRGMIVLLGLWEYV